MNESIDEKKEDERIYYKVLMRVGLQGGYQTNFIRIISMISVLCASTFFVVPYLFYQDPYQCEDYDGDCTHLVCSLPSNQRSAYLSDPYIKSLANFYGDMHCEEAGKITELQEMFLIGTSVGLILSIMFIEFFGRKMLISLSLLLTVFSILTVLFSTSYYGKSIGLFVWGASSQISFSILLSLVTQKTAEKDRLGYYVQFQVWFMVGYLINTFVFFIFKDWQLALGFYFLPFSLGATLLFYFYVESTPLQLISRENAENAFNAFMRIAKRNQITDHGLSLKQIALLQQQYKENQKKKHNYTFNLFDLFKFSSVRGDFLNLSFLQFIFMFLLYAPAFMLDELNMNIFVLGLINSGSQFITIPALKELMINYPRRKSQIILFIVATVLSFITFGLAPDDCFICNSDWKLVFTLIAFFGSRTCINLSGQLLSSSINEMFPAQIRSISIYSVIGVGRLSTIFIPYLTKLRDNLGVSLLLQFSLMSLLAIVPAFFLKQTWGTLPEEMIEQLKIEKKHQQEQ